MASVRTTFNTSRALASSSRLRPTPIFPRYALSQRQPYRQSSTAPTRLCPSCSSPIPIPSSPCPSCSRIISIPTSISHHSLLHLSNPHPSSTTIFDIPAELSKLSAYGFDLDVKNLRGKMLKRQMELHPDKYSGDEGDMRLARELSGRVNGAYEVLKDPLKRAEYLEVVTEETESLTDPMLLAEILEAREELEMAESAEEVEELRRTNQEKVDETIAAIKEAFSGDSPNFTEAKGLAVQLKYWQGLEEAAKEWSPK